MNVPTSLFMWIMACLLITALLLLMIKLQWGTTEAAPVGLAITIITGIVFYKADIRSLAAESAKGIQSALIILLIVWTTILLYQVVDETRVFPVTRNGMRKFLPNELLMALALGRILESFLQGATGFGVPVVVGVSLLMGIGIILVFAVIIPLLGQVWGNTFGTLTAAWDALAMSTGLVPGTSDYLAAALWAGVFIWMWNVVTGLAICWFYGKGKAVRKGLPALLILSLIQGGGELLPTRVNTAITCFLPACFPLVALILVGRMKMYRQGWSVEDSRTMDRGAALGISEEMPDGMTLVQASVSYILLTVVTMVVLVVPPVNRFLNQVFIGFSFPETPMGYGSVNQAMELFLPLRSFTHASMFLFLLSIAGLVYFGRHGWIRPGGVKRVFVRSVTMSMSSGIAIIGLVIMSKIMGGTGQTSVLADGIARVLGKTYVILASLVGMVGSFMTESNMSSNILFGEFQVITANLLHLNQASILGAQTAGGSIGSAIGPSNIILGTITAGILRSEGQVLKRIIPFATIMTLAIGITMSLSVAVS